MAGTAYILFEDVPLEKFGDHLPDMKVIDEDIAYVIAVMESKGRLEDARELEREWLKLRSVKS